MSIDVFSIHCDALDDARLVGFKGTEWLSRPFELDLFFTVPVGTEVKSAIGERATVTADRADGRDPLCWHGILAGIRLLHETAERALYRASLVPALWLLQQHVRSYVHTKKKVAAFVADTLKDGGLTGGDFEFHTNAGAYPQEEFVCQYRESHLDFVHRWLEREGLYYYFEHPEGPGGREKLVIVDDKAHHHPLAGDGHVRYFPAAGHDGSAGECFRELHADFRLLPASVLISDYNYANPAAPLAGENAVSKAGQGKIREYGYRVFNEAEAKRLAQVKAQSIACRELVLTATGTYVGLRAGYTFELDEGPSDLPSEYLAIEVRHAGAVSGAAPMVLRYTGLDPKETYRVDVVAIPARAQFRAPQTTSWPRIYGFENGTVDGPGESQYAQIDDQGRYLVRFKFDVSDLPDGSTSTYLRMMQPHGGTTEGWHFPLRKGTEVMVSFQGGDPDRPVIAGVVPNAVQPSNVTAKNHTQNVLRTGGGNEMIMEDIDGAQWIGVETPAMRTALYMGTPRNYVVPLPPGSAKSSPFDTNFSVFLQSRGAAGFEIGGDWWQSVGADYYLDVEGTATIHYKGAHTLQIDSASNELFLAVRTTTIKGRYTQYAKAGGSQEVTGDWTHKVSHNNHDNYGTWNTDVVGKWTAKIGGGASIDSTGQTIAIKAATIELNAPTVTIKGNKVKSESGWWKGISGPSVELYTLKESAGVQKFDAAAVSISGTGYSRSYAGTKLDVTGSSISRVGMKADKAGASYSDKGVELTKEGILAATGGFESRARSFLKLG